MRWYLTIALLLPVAAFAADGDDVTYSGRLVAEVIDEFRSEGHPFAYSTNLVTADLRVTVEPESGDPVEIVRQILKPHNLTLHTEAGVPLVVRFETDGAGDDAAHRSKAGIGPGAVNAEIENIYVSASRYEILRDMAASRFTLDQRTIETMPDWAASLACCM